MFFLTICRAAEDLICLHAHAHTYTHAESSPAQSALSAISSIDPIILWHGLPTSDQLHQAPFKRIRFTRVKLETLNQQSVVH